MTIKNPVIDSMVNSRQSRNDGWTSSESQDDSAKPSGSFKYSAGQGPLKFSMNRKIEIEEVPDENKIDSKNPELAFLS